jgi:hypothetical protein
MVVVVPIMSAGATIIVTVSRRPTGAAIPLESWAARTLALARRTGPTVAIETAARPVFVSVAWRAFKSEAESFKTLAIARWSGRTVGTAEAAPRTFAVARSWALFRTDDLAEDATFKASTAWWPRRTLASWSRRHRHVLVHEFGELFEFVFAQLAVVVFIKLVEHLFRPGHFRRTIGATLRTSLGTAPRSGVAIATFSATTLFSATALFGTTFFMSPGFTITVALAVQLAHSLASCFALRVVELAIAVFVELFEHSFA